MFERLIDIDKRSLAKQSNLKRQTKSHAKFSTRDGQCSYISTEEEAENIASKYFNIMSGNSTT